MIVDFLLAALEAAQLRSVKAFPAQQLPILAEPMVAVGILERNIQPRMDHVCLVEQSVFFDVYASFRIGAERCVEAADRIEAFLCIGIADHCITQIRRGEMYYDAPSDCFRLRITAELSSHEEVEE